MKQSTIFILVIAHPDDESMFFMPTLHTLMNKSAPSDTSGDNGSNNNECLILCLSNGNYNGLGMQRTEELKRAASIISPSLKVSVLNHPDLQDGPKTPWSRSCVEGVMVEFLERRCSNLAKVKTNYHKQNVIILTFDECGVSGHPNHVDTYLGLIHFHNKFTQSNQNEKGRLQNLSQKVNLQLQVLETIHNPFVKYFPFVELLCILIVTCCKIIAYSFILEQSVSTDDVGVLDYYMFNPRLVWRAMKAHSTQFVWYRRLFVIFSRYNYVNNLRIIGCDKSTTIQKKIK